jgi:hypothetical protein
MRLSGAYQVARFAPGAIIRDCRHPTQKARREPIAARK